MEASEQSQSFPEITEFYRDYTPPFDATTVARHLLRYVPSRYLRGIRRIVLTNASGLSHDRKRAKTWSRKRKTRVAEALGTYNQAWQGDPAWIQIFVDNIVFDFPRFVWRVPFLRDLFFAPTLFHEIGHHIHKTVRPEFREREDVAEDWERKLSRRYFWRRYWYLMPVIYPFALAVKLGNRLWDKRTRTP